MAILGIETSESPVIDKYMAETHARLQDKSLLKNPFTGKILKIYDGKRNFFIISITPIYPPYWIFGLIGFPITFFFTGIVLSWYLIPTFLFLSAGFLWTPQFFFFITRAGLKRAGYRGLIKMRTARFMLKKTVEIQYTIKEENA